MGGLLTLEILYMLYISNDRPYTYLRLVKQRSATSPSHHSSEQSQVQLLLYPITKSEVVQLGEDTA